MEWYLAVLKNYAGFTGRARRKEFWMFELIHIVVYVALAIIDGLLSLNFILPGLYILATLLPVIAVTIRRMHDTGRSGWWSLVPIANLIFAIQEGVAGSNQYGEDPKAAERGVPA